MREEDVTSRSRHFEACGSQRSASLRISDEPRAISDNIASLEKQIGQFAPSPPEACKKVFAFHVFPSCLWKSSLRLAAKVAVVRKTRKIGHIVTGLLRENRELEREIAPLESSMAERDRLADLQGTASPMFETRCPSFNPSACLRTGRLLDLAKAQVFPKYKIPSFNCLICIALSFLPSGIVC